MSKKQFFVATAVGALLIAALSVVPVQASGPTPPAECNAGHGAYTAFSNPLLHFVTGIGQPPYFGDDVLGSARKGLTGENNANYSEFCKGN